MAADWDRVIAIEVLIVGLLTIVFSYFACNVAPEHGYLGFDTMCFFQYALLGAFVCIASSVLLSATARKGREKKKKKPKEQIHISWPKENLKKIARGN